MCRIREVKVFINRSVTAIVKMYSLHSDEEVG